MTACPCTSGDTFKDCCGRFLDGSPAPTAVQLMRSRFTAYAMKNVAYVHDTWHPDFRPSLRELQDSEDIEWTRLLIHDHEDGSPFDQEGTVTFTALGVASERTVKLHETSHFVRVSGVWLYTSGEFE